MLVETNLCIVFFYFWCLDLLPSCVSTPFLPSSCLICLSNYKVVTNFLSHPTRHFFTLFCLDFSTRLALSLNYTTSLCKASSHFALMIVLNRPMSKRFCNFSIAISILKCMYIKRKLDMAQKPMVSFSSFLPFSPHLMI
jgi:hypothetical protein